MEDFLRPLLFAAALLVSAPGFAVELSADDAYAMIEENAEHCNLGKLYDGGPDLSEAEVKAACERYETAKNRLVKLGLSE
jgi:hypothetical protein